MVRIKSRVVASPALKGFRSPDYLATIRRRGAGRIAKLMAQLGDHSGDDNFVVWTHEVLESLRQLVQQLSDAEEFRYPEHEGNAVEVLRQLRDTLLDGGWVRYKEHDVRDTTVRILDELAKADEVSPDVPSRVMDDLLDLSLNPDAASCWYDGEACEVSD
jgi:hypothetical protein